MNIRLQNILKEMKALEDELADEIHKNEIDFLYKIHGKKIVFAEAVEAAHANFVVPVVPYLLDSSLFNIMSAPLIWVCLFPIALLDLVLCLYQTVCFPIYGIPKVHRGDHVVMDRSRINYLNIIEKINCAYCSYFNGVISFVQEIAGRTEQYWCPIKHARRISSMHSRYVKFLEYGEAQNYRKNFEKVRNDFSDIK
jgi:hypothetical protein